MSNILRDDETTRRKALLSRSENYLKKVNAVTEILDSLDLTETQRKYLCLFLLYCRAEGEEIEKQVREEKDKPYKPFMSTDYDKAFLESEWSDLEEERKKKKRKWLFW